METKKSSRASLQNKRLIFLEAGLLIGLGAVVLVFGSDWGSAEPVPVESDRSDYVYEAVPVTVAPKPAPAVMTKPIVVSSDLINITRVLPKTIVSDTDFAWTDEGDEGPVVPQPGSSVGSAEPDFIPPRVEIMPRFQGGDVNKFHSWVSGKVKYPQRAREKGVKGTVYVYFVIDEKGNLGRIEVRGAPDAALADEVVRVLKESPSWTPGKQGRKEVAVSFVIPVEFDFIK